MAIERRSVSQSWCDARCGAALLHWCPGAPPPGACRPWIPSDSPVFPQIPLDSPLTKALCLLSVLLAWLLLLPPPFVFGPQKHYLWMDLDPRRLLDELQPAKTIIVMAARYCKYLCQIGYENSRKKKTHQNRDISPWKAVTHLKQWNRLNDLGRQIHWMKRKYRPMGKKLNNVSILISDSLMIKFKIGD